MKKNHYTYSRTCVYNVNYHLVWCVKYRNDILTPEISDRLIEILKDIGAENGFSIEAAQIGEQDHVHCFVSAPPKLSITFIAKHLKGTSAIRLSKSSRSFARHRRNISCGIRAISWRRSGPPARRTSGNIFCPSKGRNLYGGTEKDIPAKDHAGYTAAS